jgi:hypothetical protein
MERNEVAVVEGGGQEAGQGRTHARGCGLAEVHVVEQDQERAAVLGLGWSGRADVRGIARDVRVGRDDGTRRGDHRFEARDRQRPTLFEELEVRGGEPADRRAGVVHHHHVDADHLADRAERGRLLGVGGRRRQLDRGQDECEPTPWPRAGRRHRAALLPPG